MNIKRSNRLILVIPAITFLMLQVAPAQGAVTAVHAAADGDPLVMGTTAAVATPIGTQTQPPTLTPQQLDTLIADYQAANNSAAAQAGQPQRPTQQPQRPTQSDSRYTIAPWVILLRNAISTTASAIWIASIGFLLASLGIGAGVLLWGRAQMIRARAGIPERKRTDHHE